MAVTQSDLEAARAEFDELKDESARARDAWAEKCASEIKPWVEKQLQYHARYENAVVDRLADEEIISLKKQASELAENAAGAFAGALAGKGLTHGDASNVQYAWKRIVTAAESILQPVTTDLAKLLEQAGFSRGQWAQSWEFYEGFGSARSNRETVPLPDADDYARAYLLASEAKRRIGDLETELARQRSQDRFNSL